ncbi:MAG: YCF48-related protein [Opitutaceae bacterium]
MSGTAGARLLFSLLSAVLFSGCVSSLPSSTPEQALRDDLPFHLRHPDSVTELLAATVVRADIVAVGEGGTIIRSSDSAQTWQKSVVPVSSTLTSVSFALDALHGWAVGHDAVILATADGGETWHQQWQGENSATWLLDVYAVDEHRVIAVGKNGLYVETSDGGSTWTERKLLARDTHLNRISRGPSGTLYLAGEHGTGLRSLDAGLTWTALSSPSPETLYGILPLGPKALLAYGGSMAGDVYRSENDGRTWSALHLTRQILIKTGLIMRDGSILLAGESGDWRPDKFNGYFLSRDGGHTFGPWKVVPARQHDAINRSPLIGLLQAPDGSIVSFGPTGATILGPP